MSLRIYGLMDKKRYLVYLGAGLVGIIWNFIVFASCQETKPESCTPGWFGSGCTKECHCTTAEECNPVNGFCSGGRCHPEWYGTGCQTRLPRLTSVPQVDRITESRICVTWKQWDNSTDVGNVNVVSYIVEMRVNSSSSGVPVVWLDVTQSVVMNTTPGYCHACVSGVEPGTEYEFRVIPVWLDFGKARRGFPSNSTAPVTPARILFASLSVVRSLSLELSRDGSYILIEWDHPIRGTQDLSGYTISYMIVGIGDCNSDTDDRRLDQGVVNSVTAYIIYGTVVWRRYRVTVFAVYGEDSYPLSAEIISPETEPSASPKNLRTSAVDSRSFSLAWDEVECAERGGVLRYYDARIQEMDTAAAAAAEEVRVLTNQTKMNATRLLPFTRYRVRVRYTNAIGSGPYSDDYVVMTSPEAPPAPRDVQVTNITNTTMLVTWTSPKPCFGIVLDYRVIYWKSSNGEDNPNIEFHTITAINSFQTISDLQPNAYYYIQVQARNNVTTGDGWGSRSLMLLRLTKDGRPSIPIGLMNSSRTDKCVAIEWRPPATPNGIIVSYRVVYSSLSNRSFDQEVSLPSTSLQYLVCSLNPATKYRFQVAAESREQLGDAAHLAASTEPGFPPLPAPPSAKSVTETRVTLLLQPVTSPSGPITAYYVVVHDAENNSSERNRSTDPKPEPEPEPDPTEVIPLPGNTVARLEPGLVGEDFEFAVGDGRRYWRYLNAPLKANRVYAVYYVVASEYDGATKMSVARTPFPVRTLESTTTTILLSTTAKVPSTTAKVPSTAAIVPSTAAAFLSTTTLSYSSKRIDTEYVSPETTAVLTAFTSAPVDPSAPAATTTTTTTTTLIVVVVVVVVVVLIATIAIALCCYHRQRKHHDSLELSFDKTKKKKQSWPKSLHPNNPNREPDKQPNRPYRLCSSSEAPAPGATDPDCCLEDVPVADIDLYQRRNLDAEFTALPGCADLSTSAAAKPENRSLSRNGILPFDHSRVVIRGGGGVGATDFYNASFVPNFKGRGRAYIAAESPFDGPTLRQFWLMIYQENVRHVVFLAGSFDDTPKYWPDDNSSLTHENIVVKSVSTRTFASFVVRTFVISLIGEARSRHVRQYQFLAWPDDGELPTNSLELLDFRAKIRSPRRELKQPVLVHCRTGVDKTALFVSVDSALTQARAENCVNVYEVCALLRRHRCMSIATERHYAFVCEAVAEALCCASVNPVLTGAGLKAAYRLLTEENVKSQKSGLAKQFDSINQSCSVDKGKQPAMIGGRAGLHGTELDSYHLKNAFVLMEIPAAGEGGGEVEFWKAVHARNACCVVTLGSEADRSGTPNSVRTYGSIVLETTELESHRTCAVRTVRLTYHRTAGGAAQQSPPPPPLTLRQFVFHDWSDGNELPSSRHGFVKLLRSVHDWRADRQGATVAVQCRDGATKSGLFCACYVLCERMAADGQVDVLHVVKGLKIRAPAIIGSLEQYRFCFKVLLDCVRVQRPSVDSIGGGQQAVYKPRDGGPARSVRGLHRQSAAGVDRRQSDVGVSMGTVGRYRRNSASAGDDLDPLGPTVEVTTIFNAAPDDKTGASSRRLRDACSISKDDSFTSENSC